MTDIVVNNCGARRENSRKVGPAIRTFIFNAPVTTSDRAVRGRKGEEERGCRERILRKENEGRIERSSRSERPFEYATRLAPSCD